MNFLNDLGDALTGGKLVDRTVLPYDPPLSTTTTTNEELTLTIAERPISFTGEDFDVMDATSNRPFARVRGAMLHLPGKDRLRVCDCSKNNADVVELDRKLVSLTPTYDIYRRDNNEKLGWMEKKVVALTDTFEVFLENQPSFGPFKSPAFRIEGDFIDRNFAVRNADGQVVAKVSKSGLLPQFFDSMNHYSVRIAPLMDPFLVIACACAIDEEFDEEHRERRKREQEQRQ
jgi:uncharacterized protein YxjI